ncbi:MAG: double-strand break repair protein AddB [Alphaproteobacteria bacterium]|nr:double-strand break repair protein AddB [Alphaproteobacteria bacterium]
MAHRPRVFTIPASAPFLPALIEALMQDRLGLGFKPGADPLALAGATIYLPTRRACRLAQKIFLDVLKADAAILPRIVPIGDVDEDEIAFAEAALGETDGATLDLPKSLDGLGRALPLAELILRWAATIAPRDRGQAPLIANSPAAAYSLAQDLARLMDDMATRQVPWDRLEGLVPDDHDEYWQITLRFLKFIHPAWGAHLDESGRIEPAARRDLLIAAESKRLAAATGPVIAAGSTGSIPATATLLATIAALPHGALVLPGLDTDLDAATWDTIGSLDGEAAHGHPQFAMAALLRRIGIVRDAVMTLDPPRPHGRERLVSEALRPAATSELWQVRLTQPGFITHADAAMSNVTAIEASNAEEEALAIAVALREAMTTPGKIAALVTPDRALARRVRAALKRWDVPVDDSGGDALADTPAGVFARLVAEAALEDLPPVTLLALLKHPLCRLDAAATAILERAVLRGPRPKAHTAGLEHALQTFRGELTKLHGKQPSSLHRSDPRTSIHISELDVAADLIAKLKAALAPLETLPPGAQPFRVIAERHEQAVTALAGGLTDELAQAFDDIALSGALAVARGDYVELFHAAIADRPVRRPEADVRVRIYGPLEARLQSVDRLVLGGLVEGVWPPDTRGDPWLSRPMRHTLGLDLPERRIGLSAHDFAQALGAPEVILTRAAKLGGAPTVASRFTQRLAAVAGKPRWDAALARGAHYAAMARALDAPQRRAQQIQRPEPKPPLAARPKSLSVTEIELWLRDPYSIYARHILKLRPLDEIDTPPGARDRGTVVHGAIGDFTLRFKDKLPDDVVGELIKLGEKHFEVLEDFPDARAFWWPRFQRIARWFATFEGTRRGAIKQIEAEISGTLEIPIKDGVFTLRARADRIEHRADGRFGILDYKTGQMPTAPQVRSGLSPQLSLEGAILRAGRFGAVPKGASIAEFLYVSLRGVDPPGQEKLITWTDTTPDAVADTAAGRLAYVVGRFDNPETGYASRERPMFMRRHPGDYDHLARVKEWSLSGDADDGEGEGE